MTIYKGHRIITERGGYSVTFKNGEFWFSHSYAVLIEALDALEVEKDQ